MSVQFRAGHRHTTTGAFININLIVIVIRRRKERRANGGLHIHILLLLFVDPPCTYSVPSPAVGIGKGLITDNRLNMCKFKSTSLTLLSNNPLPCLPPPPIKKSTLPECPEYFGITEKFWFKIKVVEMN